MNSVITNPTVSVPAVPPPLPGRQTRSLWVTVLAWCLMVISALGLPVSVISGFMILAGSYGTANASVLGGLLVIGGPAAGVVTGFGLWRRWRWAHAGAVALLVILALVNVASVLRGSTPEQTYLSPAGVPTTVLATNVNYPLHVLVIALATVLIVKLVSRSVRDEFGGTWSGRTFAKRFEGVLLAAPEAGAPVAASTGSGPDVKRRRDWRVGHQGRDEMFYEEWRDGSWQRLRISGEMLMGRAHHVIYFASPPAWLNYPAWAHGRRDEIIARIKSEFRAPDYEYHGEGATSTEAVAPGTPEVTASLSSFESSPAIPALARITTPSQWRALVIAVVLMLGLAGGMGWLVVHGLSQGETWFPSKRASQQRLVVRAQEPMMFWVSLGVYAAVGAGSVGLAAWGVREGWRISQREK